MKANPKFPTKNGAKTYLEIQEIVDALLEVFHEAVEVTGKCDSQQLGNPVIWDPFWKRGKSNLILQSGVIFQGDFP